MRALIIISFILWVVLFCIPIANQDYFKALDRLGWVILTFIGIILTEK